MGPSKTNLPKRSDGKNKAAFNTFLRTNLHREPRLVQDIKVTANQGRKKNLQVISHLQDDTLQRHKENNPAQENWILEVRGGFLTFQGADLWTSCSRSTGEKSRELVPTESSWRSS